MTDQIPAAGSFDSQRRNLKQQLAAAEVDGDSRTVKRLETALDDNAAAKDKLLRDEAEAAAAARKAAVEAKADGDVEAAAKTPPQGRSAAPKAKTDTQAK